MNPTEIHHSKILAALHGAHKLKGRLLIAALKLSTDCATAHGMSAGVVSSYGEDRGGGNGDRGGPAYFVSAAAQRLNELHDRLHPHERAFLGEIFKPDARPWNAIQSWGAAAGYKSDDAQRAAGVQRVLTLLASVADFYAIPQDVKNVEVA
jgi:hypothetical protein